MNEMFTDEELKPIIELLKYQDYSGWFNSHDGGKYLQEFQKKFAEECDTKHAYAVSSGSASIYTALRAVGVGPGDLVAVPTYTHIGSVAPIILAGAEPYFIDCDAYGNISPMDLALVQEMDDVKLKAIIAVHQLGLVCNMDELVSCCPDAFIIEDASHALGAEYKGNRAGSLGHIGCFSVGGGRTKTIGCCEGGVLTTNDDDLAVKIKNLRNHGDRYSDVSYFCFNTRMGDLNALLGLIQIKKLDMLNDWQIMHAKYLRNRLPGFLEPYTIPEDVKATHYLVSCFFNEEKARITRAEFLKRLKDAGSIGGVPRKNVSGGYSKLVSDIEFYKKYIKRDYIMSQHLRDTSVWIDFHRPPRTKEDIDQLVDAMTKVVE